MQNSKTTKGSGKGNSKLADYKMFLKIRLASLVVFSASLTYIIASGSDFSYMELLWVIVGGFLVTGASNGFNQVWEKETDKLMERTSDRPLPQERMGVKEGMAIALITGMVGVIVLWYFLNPLTGILGLISLLLYATIYTPMKKKSSWAVFIGAFPGALPPMIGWIAFTGEFSPEAVILFAIQFMWQFPHFWAIAWRSHEDYKKAGFHLLPSGGGKNKRSAAQILVYTLFMIPVSLFPMHPLFGQIGGWFSAVFCIASGLLMLYPAYKLFNTLEDKWATKLMFASFVYLPVILIALLIDQLFIL